MSAAKYFFNSSKISSLPNFIIVEDVIDSAYLDIGGGSGYQLNRQTIGSLEGRSDGMRVLNPFLSADKNDYIFDLSELTTDASGNLLNNTAFNLVFVLSINSADGQDLNWLGVLLPTDVYGYTDIVSCAADENNTAVSSVPFQTQETAVLLCRVPVRFKNDQWRTHRNYIIFRHFVF